jgi:hypothetical protein
MALNCTPFHKRYNGFRFQAWWLHTPGFMDSVKQSWEQPVNSLNKARASHIKLARLAKALKNWSKGHLRRLKQEAHDAEQLVLPLDQQQDI